MNINENDLKNINTMLHLYSMEVGIKSLHRMVFHRRHLSDEEMQQLHEACLAATETERTKGLAVRAEMIAMLYVCQPEALFRKMPLETTVVTYYSKVMHMKMANFSAYKTSLVFLYFNDKIFRAVAKKTIEAAMAIFNDKNN